MLSDLSFTQLVNDALRNYQSTLALSRSALANSPLVTPTLVKDEASATAEERGHGLRLILQWAVDRLAPGAPTYAMGEYRPLDDPSWRDPHWWQYNILRHRYLEPLHPDDFVDGGRYTESLLALTGISSADAFFDERNRAVRAVAERLRQQLIDGQGNRELQRLALQEALAPLEKQREATCLLGIAATFDEIFPRTLLLEMAEAEEIAQADKLLEALILQRFLLTGDEDAKLWLSPTLRIYIYARQPKAELPRRHRRAAVYYDAQHDSLQAARHWQRAKQPERALTLLFAAADDLVNEFQMGALLHALNQFEEQTLMPEQWRDLQILLSDLYRKSGQQEDALAACRRALKVTQTPMQQARIYRRMGKLYEKHNPLHALGYYDEAAKRFSADDPELPYLLKDRGWLYILRRDWEKAEADLQQSLAVLPAGREDVRADIYDALASLYRRRGAYDSAITYARNALAIREARGEMERIAISFNNLGVIYLATQNYDHGIAAYREALAIFEKLGNLEPIAGAQMNIGCAYHRQGNLHKAIPFYEQTLTLCANVALPHLQAQAHYNMAEALAVLGEEQRARRHWGQGYAVSTEHGFQDQIEFFRQLLAQQPILQAISTPDDAPTADQTLAVAPLQPITPDEQAILALVEQQGQITPKTLMEATYISRATATRRLTALVEKGVLIVEGKGRGTFYCLAQSTGRPVARQEEQAQTDVEEALVTATLCQHKTDLIQCYGLRALSLATPAGSQRVRLIVHFDPVPDLSRYFQIRRHLVQLLQQEVDLIPEAEAALSSEISLTHLWSPS